MSKKPHAGLDASGERLKGRDSKTLTEILKAKAKNTESLPTIVPKVPKSEEAVKGNGALQAVSIRVNKKLYRLFKIYCIKKDVSIEKMFNQMLQDLLKKL